MLRLTLVAIHSVRCQLASMPFSTLQVPPPGNRIGRQLGIVTGECCRLLALVISKSLVLLAGTCYVSLYEARAVIRMQASKSARMGCVRFQWHAAQGCECLTACCRMCWCLSWVQRAAAAARAVRGPRRQLCARRGCRGRVPRGRYSSLSRASCTVPEHVAFVVHSGYLCFATVGARFYSAWISVP